VRVGGLTFQQVCPHWVFRNNNPGGSHSHREKLKERLLRANTCYGAETQRRDNPSGKRGQRSFRGFPGKQKKKKNGGVSTSFFFRGQGSFGDGNSLDWSVFFQGGGWGVGEEVQMSGGWGGNKQAGEGLQGDHVNSPQRPGMEKLRGGELRIREKSPKT